MGAIANNYMEQIEKLRSRGMDLDFDDAKIKEILLDIGYYRLGFYWHPFTVDHDHNFAVGTKFSDAVCLYYLDVDLRNIILKYINRIEINFRTKVVYYVSNKYKQSPIWFIDPKVISHEFIDNIEHHYNADFKKNHKPIRLHHQNKINDKYAPAWKTLEFFTFGAVLKVFKSLKDPGIKDRIALEYGVRNLSKFINIMETIVHVRNTCAHGGVIFDLTLPKGIAALPMVTFNNNNRHSLDSSMKIVELILCEISEGRKDDMNLAVRELFEKHAENLAIKKIIEDKIGFVF